MKKVFSLVVLSSFLFTLTMESSYSSSAWNTNHHRERNHRDSRISFNDTPVRKQLNKLSRETQLDEIKKIEKKLAKFVYQSYSWRKKGLRRLPMADRKRFVAEVVSDFVEKNQKLDYEVIRYNFQKIYARLTAHIRENR